MFRYERKTYKNYQFLVLLNNFLCIFGTYLPYSICIIFLSYKKKVYSKIDLLNDGSKIFFLIFINGSLFMYRNGFFDRVSITS